MIVYELNKHNNSLWRKNVGNFKKEITLFEFFIFIVLICLLELRTKGVNQLLFNLLLNNHIKFKKSKEEKL